jgi:hypothetical protein
MLNGVKIMVAVWCKPGWPKNCKNVTFYEFVICPIYKYVR